MKQNILILVFFVSTIFIACKKIISLNLEKNTSQLVIEGIVTDQPGPYFVKISKTVNFTDANIFPSVSGAKITIADNTGYVETLTETAPGTYSTQHLQGVSGRTYTLNVWLDGANYSATSTMPPKVGLSDVRFLKVEAQSNQDKEYRPIPIYMDPATEGNSYRFLQWKNGKRIFDETVFNDNVDNGLINERPIVSDTTLSIGDTFKLEMDCIDSKVYDYFYTHTKNQRASAGSGSTLENPQSNISGGVLGYFSAHTAEQITKVVSE